jgi:methylmalonyl-CoA carboxyltransferase large subunit
MTSEVDEGQRLADTLEALQRQLAALTERVAALEATGPVAARSTGPVGAPAAAAGGVLAAAGPVRPASPVVAEGMSEETLLVISAAIAAFLGKKPQIRQIRLVNSATWAQQGRAGIHASHAFAHSRSGAAS